MDVRESLVLLDSRESPVPMVLLEVLAWLELAVALEREVAPVLLDPLVLVVLMATLDPPAPLVPSVLLDPQDSPVAPAPRERLEPLEPVAQVDPRDLEESPVSTDQSAPLALQVTLVLMACLELRELLVPLVLLELLASPDQEEDPDPRDPREPLDREVSLETPEFRV